MPFVDRFILTIYSSTHNKNGLPFNTFIIMGYKSAQWMESICSLRKLEVRSTRWRPYFWSIFVNMIFCFYLCSQSLWLAVYSPSWSLYNGYKLEGSELDIGRNFLFFILHLYSFTQTCFRQSTPIFLYRTNWYFVLGTKLIFRWSHNLGFQNIPVLTIFNH